MAVIICSKVTMDGFDDGLTGESAELAKPFSREG